MYRFFEAGLQILDLNFLLKRDMADGVPLLTKLAPEVLAETNDSLRYYPGRGRIHSLLSLKHLNLALQPSAIVLSRTFEVVVHLLDVGHEIGKMRSLHC
jgi:hypothetical protein